MGNIDSLVRSHIRIYIVYSMDHIFYTCRHGSNSGSPFDFDDNNSEDLARYAYIHSQLNLYHWQGKATASLGFFYHAAGNGMASISPCQAG